MNYPVISPLHHDGVPYPIGSEIAAELLTDDQVVELLALKTIAMPAEPAAEDLEGQPNAPTMKEGLTGAAESEGQVSAAAGDESPVATAPGADPSAEAELVEVQAKGLLIRAARLLAEAVSWTPGMAGWREEVMDLFEQLGIENPFKLCEGAGEAVPSDGTPAHDLPEPGDTTSKDTPSEPGTQVSAEAPADGGQPSDQAGGNADLAEKTAVVGGLEAKGTEPATAKLQQAKPAAPAKKGKQTTKSKVGKAG